MDDLKIECPVCGGELSEVLTIQLRSLSASGTPEKIEPIDCGRCQACNVRLQRRRGETAFHWYPTCGKCNAEMAFVQPVEPNTLLYRCSFHPEQTFTYRPALNLR